MSDECAETGFVEAERLRSQLREQSFADAHEFIHRYRFDVYTSYAQDEQLVMPEDFDDWLAQPDIVVRETKSSEGAIVLTKVCLFTSLFARCG